MQSDQMWGQEEMLQNQEGTPRRWKFLIFYSEVQQKEETKERSKEFKNNEIRKER